MGIKQHNGNTKADRLAELKIRSPSIQLIKFGAIGLNAIIFSPLLIAADTGSQYGTNITINDGDRITGDTADPSGNLYGVMTPAGNTPGNINLGNDVTVNVNDASGYAKGIIIQGKNSSLTANRLTVDVVGQTSAIGINLIGDYTHADLGTGSTIKSNDDGIIIGHSSTLTATQFTIENSNGIGLTINDYGTSVDLGSGSKITTDGSTGVYIGGLNGNNANGAARFTATDLTIDVQGYSAMGINVQKNSVVDLGTNSTIKTNGDNAHGLWSFGQVSANALKLEPRPMASKFVVVQPLSVQIAIFLPRRAVASSPVVQTRQSIFLARQRNETASFPAVLMVPRPRRQRLLSTCKIPILQLIVMAVWRWVCGRSAAVE